MVMIMIMLCCVMRGCDLCTVRCCHHHKQFNVAYNVNYCKDHRCSDSSDEWWCDSVLV